MAHEYEVTFNGDYPIRYATPQEALRAVADDARESGMLEDVGRETYSEFLASIETLVDLFAAPGRNLNDLAINDPATGDKAWRIVKMPA